MVVHCSLVFQDTMRRNDVEGKNWDVAIFFVFFVFRHRMNEKCRDYGKTDFLSDHFHVYSVLTLIVVCYFMRKSAWNDDDCDSHVYLSSDDARVNYFSVDFFSLTLGCRPNGEKKMGKISLVCEMKWIKIPRQWCYFILPQSMLVRLVCVRDKTANKDNRQQMTAEKNCNENVLLTGTGMKRVWEENAIKFALHSPILDDGGVIYYSRNFNGKSNELASHLKYLRRNEKEIF